MPLLPEISKVELDVVADRSAEPKGFLIVKRYDVSIVAGDQRSAVFRYDLLERRALDAAVMVAHFIGADGTPHVYLRSAIRPPIGLSRPKFVPGEPPVPTVLWELPAGLIEPGEEPRSGASRELEEELGFRVDPHALVPLGPNTFPAPGFIGEMHWFFHVRVDPTTRVEPKGDGSPLEATAQVITVPLATALAACQTGEIRDAKTELALLRLHTALSA